MNTAIWIKSDLYDGFYEIPGFNKYVVNTYGKVLDKRYGREMKPHLCHKGYYHYALQRDNGLPTRIGRYRVVALAFIEQPILTGRLVVNHLNGIKTDDYPENLEWTNDQGNLEHAGRLGLTTKCRPILVRDVLTGKITEYASYIECARAQGVSKDAINFRLKAGEDRVFPEMLQYRHAEVTTEWKVPEDVEHVMLLNSTLNVVHVRYLLTGVVKTFDKQRDLAAELGIAESTLSIWLNKENQPILPGMIQVKYAYDKSPWRDVSDPYLELDLLGKQGVYDCRIIVVTNPKTGSRDIYQSLAACAKAMGLKIPALHYRVQLANPDKVFRDGFNYCYYSDMVQTGSSHTVTCDSTSLN